MCSAHGFGHDAAMNPQAPLLEVRALTKRYGSVTANDRVDLGLHRGEVHALLGENGAGKSTLSKIIYGFIRPDSGAILVGGNPVEVRSPRDARALGIGMVFQNFMLIPALSVLDNVALFLTDLPPVVRREAVARRIGGFAERFGLGVDPSVQVRQLAVGDQQKVEILKLLLARARVLILDEPTKVLAPHEVVALFRVFGALKAEGYAILFITHKLREVLACADRITVMRHGRVVGGFGAGEADMDSLVAMMFGGRGAAAKPAGAAVPARPRPGAAPVLELRRASSRASGRETSLKGLDMTLGAGEIVGVAGVSASGQKELGDLILGFRPLARGSKWFCGADASSWSIARMRASGVAFVPEDPLVMAAVAGMTVRQNLVLGTGRRYWKGATIDWPALESAMTDSFRTLAFPVPRLDSPMAALSGGNLQRVVIAREMAHKPRLIVALYPTRGLDVLSAASVRDLLRRVRDGGGAVLLISEDLEELAEMADRLLVLYAGAIAGEFARGAWHAEQVGHLMTGSKEQIRA
jgi:general nucleoside transport system ATP-binding protein